MKQVLQSVRTGSLSISELPVPKVEKGQILVRVATSLISGGTERYITEFAKKGLVEKAKARPDLVRQVFNKVRQEGFLTALETVRNRLDQPQTLGYCNAGTVLAVDESITDIRVNDRVACGGGNWAFHAEVVSVPRNLIVKLPGNVDFESGAFAALGAIAHHGIHLSDVRLGELVCVIGLGLVGQITVQLLKAAGCTVVGMDIDQGRSELAYKLGANAVAKDGSTLLSIIQSLSRSQGADAVLISADTKSNEPVELAGQVARDRGVVVALGTVGMTIPRKLYYEKELEFRISRSYGPGRYDSNYEEKGRDYPIGYVRWTENRNMQAFVQLLAEGKINVKPLITHRFSIEEATKAYDLITGKTKEPYLGILLTYPDNPDLSRKIVINETPNAFRLTPNESVDAPSGSTPPSTICLLPSGSSAPHSSPLPVVKVGLLGAGNFATSTLLPAMKKIPGIELIGVCSATGVSARHAGDKFGFRFCTTDEKEIIDNPDVNTVVITTRHDLHARQVIAALKAGKHVFVEKPLCINEGELKEIVEVYTSLLAPHASRPALMVGYNRRFAPFVAELKGFLQGIHEPLMFNYRVNAGYIPPDHWTQDLAQGGGRLLGEVCHFIDLLIYLRDCAAHKITAIALPDNGRYSKDNLLITLEFNDGSIGTITYTAAGGKGFGKELLEVFGGGLSGRLEDYRLLSIIHGNKHLKKVARLRKDKGHKNEWLALVAYLTGKGPTPMAFDEVIHSAKATLMANRSLHIGESVILRQGQTFAQRE